MRCDACFSFRCKWPSFLFTRLLELFLYPCFLKTWPVFLGATHFNVQPECFVQGGGVAEIEWVGAFS